MSGNFVWTVPGLVVRVIDADTVVLDLDMGWRQWRMNERCRLLGVNAPETSTDAGKQAREMVRQLLPAGTAVTFRSHSVDNFGRSLGNIQLPDGMDLGQLLLAAGHAVPYRVEK